MEVSITSTWTLRHQEEFHQTLRPELSAKMHLDPRPLYDMALSYLGPSDPTTTAYDTGFAMDEYIRSVFNVLQAPLAKEPASVLMDGLPEVREARNAMVNVSDCSRIKSERGPESLHASAVTIAPQDVFMRAMSSDTDFGTGVDTLMRAIQTKSQEQCSTPQAPPLCLGYGQFVTDPVCSQLSSRSGRRRSSTGWVTKLRRCYQCDVSTCGKAFSQKTHLEIHRRAHTGYKPFVSFTQP